MPSATRILVTAFAVVAVGCSAAAVALDARGDPQDERGELCKAPTPLSTSGPNVLLIGDSISMGSYGYSLFVQDMLGAPTQNCTGVWPGVRNCTGAALASVQHGGGFGWHDGQMANSANGVAKVTACMGNATGKLRPKAWNVITYNAGLHDCDAGERVLPAAYRANIKAVLETLKPAADAVAFIQTTPFDIMVGGKIQQFYKGNMSCVLEYNAISREVAAEVGGIVIGDLYSYVEDFCHIFNPAPPSSGYAGNYTSCAVQRVGLHFFTTAPYPSGQQYTGLSVAQTVLGLIPATKFANTTTLADGVQDPGLLQASLGQCGDGPAPLNSTLPNVLIIGDSISEPSSGYGPGVETIMMRPGSLASAYSPLGALASVQHNGAKGSNQAGPSPNGVACVDTWLGHGKWDVITMNFGIHDCCPGGDGRAPGVNVPKADYIRNLGAIYAKASAALAPGGKIVWVSTTPVPSVPLPAAAPFLCGLSGDAFNTCIDDYNAAALQVLAGKPDVEVLDLNSAVRGACGKNYSQCNLQRYHNVHFTDAGKQFCAVQVSHAVAPLLAPKWFKLTPNSPPPLE